MCLINTKDDCSFQLFARPKEIAFRFVAFFLICSMISAKSVFLSGIQNKDTKRLRKILILFVYKEIYDYMSHLLSWLDCSGRLKQATREESRLCLFKWTRKEFGETATYPCQPSGPQHFPVVERAFFQDVINHLKMKLTLLFIKSL